MHSVYCCATVWQWWLCSQSNVKISCRSVIQLTRYWFQFDIWLVFYCVQGLSPTDQHCYRFNTNTIVNWYQINIIQSKLLTINTLKAKSRHKHWRASECQRIRHYLFLCGPDIPLPVANEDRMQLAMLDDRPCIGQYLKKCCDGHHVEGWTRKTGVLWLIA